MRKFTDAAGREWLVKVRVPGLRRLLDQLDVNLCFLLEESAREDGGLFVRLYRDRILLSRILWVLVQPEAANRKPPVTEDDFYEQVFGEHLAAARDALLDAVADFFDAPAERVALLAARKEMANRMEEARRAVEATDGNASGAAPESSASSPATT